MRSKYFILLVEQGMVIGFKKGKYSQEKNQGNILLNHNQAHTHTQAHTKYIQNYRSKVQVK